MKTIWITLLVQTSFFFGGQMEAQEFANYEKNLNIIKKKYEDPWFSERDLVKGLKIIQICERKYLNEDPVGTVDWIITSTGKIFEGSNIAKALHEIDYFPTDEADALRIGIIMLHDYYVITNKNDTTHVSTNILEKSQMPKVSKLRDSYEVTLYATHISPYFRKKVQDEFDLFEYKITMSKTGYIVIENDLNKQYKLHK